MNNEELRKILSIDPPLGYVFIYTLSDPRTPDNIRYVGKADNLWKRFREHVKNVDKVMCHKNSWIISLLNENLEPIIQELTIVPKSEWEFWERHYISLFRSWGFKLTNMNDGGQGGAIAPHYTNFMRNKTWEEIYGKEKAKRMRKKLSKSLKNKKKSSEHRKNLSLALKNRTIEEIHGIEKATEIRKKMSKALKNKTRTKKHCLALSKATKGKPKRRWIHNEQNEQKSVLLIEVSKYLSEGWILGKIK